MSVENLKKFGQLCVQDEIVRARAKEIGINDPDGLMAYADRELDLEFTQDDMMKLAREAGASQDELSEEDLEQIAGGVFTTTIIIAGGALAASAVGMGAVTAIGVGAVIGLGVVTSEVW